MKRALEKTVQAEVEREIGAEPDFLLLRNTVGVASYTREDGRVVRYSYGLGDGSPDLVGILRGDDGIGRWCCFEVKTEDGELRKTQTTTIPIWRKFGALVYVVRSAAEGRAALEMARGTLKQALGRTC
jgi:hypothetical protein